MSNKIQRHEIFQSPVISVKHQRINTDQKAPNMSKQSQTKLFHRYSPKIQEILKSLMNYLQRYPSGTASQTDIRLHFCLCPLNGNIYDISLYQTLQLLSKRNISQPERISDPLIFYNAAWSICCSTSLVIKEDLDELFHQFISQYSLDSSNPNENQILKLGQLELATFLLFLSWNDHALRYLQERNVLEIIINGILSSLHATAKKPHRVLKILVFSQVL